MDSRSQDYLKCGLINIQSVGNKTISCSELITESKFDILLITETWLDGTSADKAIIKALTPPTHKFFHNPRVHKKGGGVGIVINKICKNVKIIKEFKPKSYEYIEMNFTVNNRKFKLLNIYRPEGNLGNFLNELGHHLDAITNELYHTIITGDVNCWTEILTDRKAKRLIELFDLHNIQIQNSEPTSRDGHTLDIIAYPEHSQIANYTETFDYFGGVHFLITFSIPISRRKIESTELVFRLKKFFIPEQYIDKCIEELEVAGRQECLCIPDTNREILNCVNCYTCKYNEIYSMNYNAMCPLVTKSVKSYSESKWINAEILAARKVKRLKELRWRKSKTDLNRAEFTEARNRVNRLIFKCKKKFFNSKLQENKKDIKKLNKILNELSGNVKEKMLPTETNS